MSSKRNSKAGYRDLSPEQFYALPAEERAKIYARLSIESVKEYAGHPERLFRDLPHRDILARAERLRKRKPGEAA